jgi:hypothetical protein
MKLSNAKIMAKKNGMELSLLPLRYWYYRATISEPTPWDVSILLIISLHKNYQFSKARFKANASNIFI